jgi:HSP20 family protein
MTKGGSIMALLPGRYLGELSTFRRDIDRLLERFFDDLPRLGTASGDWTPPLDIAEAKDSLTITAELPGMEAKDLEVAISGDTVTIKGEKKQEHESKGEHYHLVERASGAFARTVHLPAPVAAEKSKASFKNGVLTITLPKTEAAKQQAIPITVA